MNSLVTIYDCLPCEANIVDVQKADDDEWDRHWEVAMAYMQKLTELDMPPKTQATSEAHENAIAETREPLTMFDHWDDVWHAVFGMPYPYKGPFDIAKSCDKLASLMQDSSIYETAAITMSLLLKESTRRRKRR